MSKWLSGDLSWHMLLSVEHLKEQQKRQYWISSAGLYRALDACICHSVAQYMWKRGRFVKTICSKHAGISSQIPDPFLFNFSCPFDPPDTLSYQSTARRSNPNTVNGNLGIILHAAQETWKAGHGDWFSNNREIWDKSWNICVLITRVVGGVTAR